MSPNLYLAIRKLFHPDEWKIFNKAKILPRVVYETTPVPGIYHIDETGRRFLIAIKPVLDRNDSELIFKYRTPAEFPRTPKDPGQKPLIYHRLLRDPPEVRYCQILGRYMFHGEMKRRQAICNCYDGQFTLMFRLDNPFLYVKIGRGKYEKHGKVTTITKMPKVPKNLKGINEDLWFHNPDTLVYRQMGVEEAQRAREEMEGKGRNIWYEDGSESYMKVQRYLIEPIYGPSNETAERIQDYLYR
ncbi:hypothetical protein DSL72_009308 [Monilinia vaccinii-corymbosi]|uniref:Uncharacterized protein n=1 Tax=Monilinia vaccinii-corymbosi TaxID=61207 RepID=A0A8A3PQQ9_9HELO|nr:hypothetical protein DSL72_009308 [Monilinia vaccinii-corymbosi]